MPLTDTQNSGYFVVSGVRSMLYSENKGPWRGILPTVFASKAGLAEKIAMWHCLKLTI